MTKRDKNGTRTDTGNDIQGDAPSGSNADPYGDDQGTRVGHPSTPHRDNAGDKTDGKSGGKSGGSTAGTADESTEAAVAEERKKVHKPGYGGEGGEPRTSSDQR